MIILGNEALTNTLGFGIGSNLCLNSGATSHTKLDSKNGGMSKATTMALCFLVCPQPLELPMSYQDSWYPLDMLQIQTKFIPLITALCNGLDHHFWVSSIFGFWIEVHYHQKGCHVRRLL